MTNAFDSIIATLGQTVTVALKTTSETGVDHETGTPAVRIRKREEISAIVLPPTKEVLERMGIELQGDCLLYTREQLDLDNEILISEVEYRVTQEVVAPFLYAGSSYVYVLARLPKVSTLDDTEGFVLELEIQDTLAIAETVVIS